MVENVLSFDSFDDKLREQLTGVFNKFGIPLGLLTHIRRHCAGFFFVLCGSITQTLGVRCSGEPYAVISLHVSPCV